VLTAVPGIRVGHFTDAEAGTGCTVVIPPRGTLGAVDVRGGAPGTRETDPLSPLAANREVTAVLLTGGSAFGLAAAAGVERWCEQQGLGVDVGGIARVPIVPAAVIFDLGITGNARRPGPDDAYAACEAASGGPHAVGSVGAGAGATVGKLLGPEGWCKGGLGAASVRLPDGVTVAALAVVNAFGDVLDERGDVLAGAWAPERGFVRAWEHVLRHPWVDPRMTIMASTTLAVVATDARLTKTDAALLAQTAHAGMCRAIAPVHTPFDGDLIFCLATGARPSSVVVCGIAAGEVLAAAVRAGVRAATSLRGVPTAAERRAG
jgi:L-aminopeptidase/D-esterase-like protein